MFLRKAAAFGLCLLSMAATVAAQDCHIALQGHVYDAETSEPLAYATVRVAEAAKGALTDDSGYYIISDLCEGRIYTVTVGHIECEHQTQLVHLTENRQTDFRLSHSVLREVVITEKAVAPPPAQAQTTVAGAELDAAKSGGLGETLRRLPGVALLSTGATIAKPVIQGLHSNRIAIIAQNVALEGQQWGSEHAPEVDPFTADRITVVKGAAGVRYGPGALGGAVVLEPAPLRDTAGFGGWLALGGRSNGRSGTLAGALDGRLHGIGFRLQATAKRSGNLRTPDYWLDNTGTAELNGALLVGWARGRWQHEFAATRFDQRLGVLRAAHIGNTTDLQRALESDRPLNNRDTFRYSIDRPYQSIQHHLVKYKTSWQLTEKWKLSGQYAFQYNRRREYDAHAPLSDPQDLEKKPQLSFRIWTNNLDLALEHQPKRHWQGGIGVQGLQQTNFVGRGGLIPDYQLLGASIWAMERWRRYPSPWEFELGARYDYRQSHATSNETFHAIDTTVRFGSLSGTAGVIYRLSRGVSFTLNTAYAARPPHVNELFARGIHHGAATYEQGRSDLVPEKAWNTNLTFDWRRNGAAITATLYHNRITDFIYLQPQNELVLTVRGAFPAYFYAQTDATIQGLDASLSWPALRHFALEARASLLRARQSGDTAEPNGSTYLPLMPADRFEYGLKWTLAPSKDEDQVTFIRLLATTVLRQTRVPETGLVKAPPPGYTLLALDAAHRLTWHGHTLELGLAVQNLSNQRYRDYLNFFRLFTDEPGINVSVRAKYYL